MPRDTLFKFFYLERHVKRSVMRPSSTRLHSKTTAYSEPGEQKLIIQAIVNCMIYKKSSKRHEEITDTITYYLCKDMVPPNIINRAGFQKII